MSPTIGPRPTAPAQESSRNIRVLWPEVGFIAFGLASALVVAALLAWTNLTFHVAFFAWSFWVIIPAGAFLCGMASGGGYILAARLLRRKPGPIAHIGAVCTSALG